MKPLDVLAICQYFPPDIGGGSRRASNAISGLERLGHKVEVIAAFPHYPHGNIPSDYKRKIIAIERNEGRRVIRVWVPPIPHAGAFRRLVMYLTFSFTALFALVVVKRPNVIWAANTNVFTSFPAKILSFFLRAPVVRNVDDLWPETAVEEGVLDRKLVAIGEILAKVAYSSCRTITPISSEYIRQITKKYHIPLEKFYVAEVGVDTDLFHPDCKLLSQSRKFRVMYSGILGPGYDFETLVEAASVLSDDQGIEFIIRGSGENKDDIVANIKSRRLTNISMHDQYLLLDELVGFLATADVLILPMKSLGSHAAGIPTKLFEYMACGRPIICTCTGETNMIIRKAKCGLIVHPGRSKDLVDAIKTLKSNPEMCDEMGRNGRDYVVNHFSIKKIGEKLERAFFAAINDTFDISSSPS